MKVYPYTSKKNINFVVDNITKHAKKKGFEVVEQPEEADVILSIGGDGTFLRAARFGKPVLPINYGTVGHITNNEPAEYLLENLARQNFIIERYPTIRVVSDLDEKFAVNDFVIRSSGGKITIVEIESEFYRDYIMGDGVILSTPLGSASYNRAAGGPIIDLKANVVAISAIAPYRPYFPRVIAAPFKCTVRMKRRGSAYVDGMTIAFKRKEFFIEFPGGYVEVIRAGDGFRRKHIEFSTVE